MEVTYNKNEEKLIVSLKGRLDSSNVRELESSLKENLVGIKELIFDFTELDYLSSAGLRVLLASHKLMSGNMTIKNVNQAILDVFRMTGMSTLLNIE